MLARGSVLISREQIMGDKIVQLVPIQGESGQLFAFYGLDSTGLLWYGELDRWGHGADQGPGVVKWRRVDGQTV
jgi:hypothetical protein